MPGFTITRGLGGGPSSLIARGFTDTVTAVIKGGARFVKRAVADLGQNIKISAMLISANGKELSRPIVNNISKIFKPSSDISIDVLPKTLIQRRAEKAKVTAKLRNINNEQD